MPTTDHPQRFDIGYHLNTWDLAGLPHEDAFAFLSQIGFRWFEALIMDSLSSDFARRNMSLGDPGPPVFISDVDILQRFANFSRAQEDYGLRLASLYANPNYINPKIWPYERDVMITVARLLKGHGANILVAGGGPPARDRPHTDAEYQAFARALEEIGAYTNKLGIRTVYHPHLDCFIETRDQLDRFMAVVDTDLVGLCIDPTHLYIAGSDPVAILRDYIDHVDYVHYKDCKAGAENLSGYDRYLSFCELGAGVIDLPEMTDILLANDYDGLVIIELDASEKSAEQSCAESVDYMTQELGLKLNVNA
ncbi:MAG: sugar phosphate isomerase/epimerase [Thermomicrobiales bacterium]